MTRALTIAAIATAPGPAGVAVVRVSGPEALAIAARLTGTPVTRRGLYFRKIYAAADKGQRASDSGAARGGVID